MRYAVFLPNFGPFGDPESLLDLAQTAEGAGWDGFFIWDHIHLEGAQTGPMVDPWVALAAIAHATEHLRLGTMITPLARRRPWKLARETTTLDHLSSGRLTLGVGLGFPPAAELGAFGEDTDDRRRAERLDEGLELLDRFWSGEEFSYTGRHFEVQRACFLPTPVQRPRIPVWCGGWWPNRKPFRRAAKWDGVIPELVGGATPRPEEVAQIRAYVDEHRPEEAGAFDIAVNGYSEPDRAAEIVEEYAAAGLTWWLERFDTSRLFDLGQARERILAGPHGIAPKPGADQSRKDHQ